MKILVLAGDIPATSSMPGSPRLFNLSRELSKNHHISLMAVCQSQERYQWFLEDPCSAKVFSEVTILPPPLAPTWWNKQKHRLHLAPHLLTKYLYPEYHSKICSIIYEKITAKQSIDIIYVDGLAMTQYVDVSQNTPAIVDLHDCHTLLSERTTKMEKRLIKKIALYLETWGIAKWEKSLRKSFNLIITNSSVDESFIKKLSPSAPTLTITNGVDSDYFSPANNTTWNAEKLVFTGVMDYGPNEDAVLYFCREIFPRIKEQCPKAEFWAVGQAPSSQVRSLAQQPGVCITGRVDDVRPYLQSAGIFVCPLRYGAGIKNKILAAMAMRKPVVATPISLDGLDVRPDQEVLVADSTEDFVKEVLRLLKDERLSKRLEVNGYNFVIEKYSWKSKALSFESTLKSLLVNQEVLGLSRGSEKAI